MTLRLVERVSGTNRSLNPQLAERIRNGAEDATLLEVEQHKWIVYRSGDFDIAAPYVEDAGLFAKDGRKCDDDWGKCAS